METEKIRNVIRDTRRGVKYIIWADETLNREEMLKVLRIHMSDTLNIRPKRGSVIEITKGE